MRWSMGWQRKNKTLKVIIIEDVVRYVRQFLGRNIPLD